MLAPHFSSIKVFWRSAAARLLLFAAVVALFGGAPAGFAPRLQQAGSTAVTALTAETSSSRIEAAFSFEQIQASAKTATAPNHHESSSLAAPIGLAGAVVEIAPVAVTEGPAETAVREVVLVEAETWDAESLANVQQAIALLPANVLAQLGNPALGPVQILVNFEGRTGSGFQPYGRAANFFSTGEGINEVVLYPRQRVFTVLHELGHAYNLRGSAAGNYASVLLEPEMRSFMAATGWRVLTPDEQLSVMNDQAKVALAYDGPPVWESLSHNDPLEDFANSFALYFSGPQELQLLSPERFAWFSARFES